MATPTYTVKLLRVEKMALDLEVKAALDESVYAWPSLAVRALAEGPGSPLAALDLGTREGVARAAEAWVERVEILATRKGLAHYRVCAKKPGLTGGLKKGQSWPSSALHVDDPTYGPGVLAAGGKLAAVVVRPGSVVPCGAVELLAVTKKGPGATKGWLDHPGVSGVDALGDRILSWSPSEARVWSDSMALLERHEAEILCACLTPSGVAIGTSRGLLLDGELLAVGGVRALARAGRLLHLLTEEGEVISLSGKVEQGRMKGVPGSGLAAHGAELAIAGDDLRVHWYREGSPIGTAEHIAYEGRRIHTAAPLAGGLAIAGSDEVYVVRGDGRRQELEPPLAASWISAEDGLVLAITYSRSEVVRARLWREDGACVGGLVLPQGNLHRAQLAPRPPPIRLTRDGAWVLCAEKSYQSGGVRLVGTRGQGQVRFPNPNPRYDFITDVESIREGAFLVGYGNHDALVWSLDGTHRTLGARVSSIWSGGGRLLTSHGKEITEWDAELAPMRKIEIDVPYDLHWLETSGDGRFMVAGAQPRAWVHDLQTGESWELSQPGGVDQLVFAGHLRYVTTQSADRGESQLRIWDVLERRVVASFGELGHPHGISWISDDELLVAVSSGVLVVDARGGARRLVSLPSPVPGPSRVRSVAFDGVGRLFTDGERSYLQGWPSPGQSKGRGGDRGPYILEYEPDWSIALGNWPPLAMRMPV